MLKQFIQLDLKMKLTRNNHYYFSAIVTINYTVYNKIIYYLNLKKSNTHTILLHYFHHLLFSNDGDIFYDKMQYW